MIKRLFPKSEKGSLSLEAALMLPFILTTWLMIANFMNLFVAHLVIQQALNNTVRVVSQYSYLITRYQGNKYLEEITYDGDTFKKAKDIKDNTKKAYDSGKEEVENIKTLKKEIVDSEQDINDLKGALDTTIQNIKDPSGESAKDLPDNIEKVTENAEKLFGNLQKKEITPGNINEKVVQPAKEFGSSVKAVYETIKDINGDNVKNYFRFHPNFFRFPRSFPLCAPIVLSQADRSRVPVCSNGNTELQRTRTRRARRAQLRQLPKSR